MPLHRSTGGRSLRRRLLPLAALPVLAWSCGAGPRTPETLGESTAAIAYGTADTIHTAVVAVLAPLTSTTFHECTGSIVQVTAGHGYVLTAAHCCNDGTPTLIVASDDYTIGEQYLSGGTPVPPVFPVIASSVYFDAKYGGLDHDFCMLQFSGATAGMSTLALPTSASDGVSLGVSVEHIGYGQTESSTTNTGRRTGTEAVNLMVTPLILQWNEGGATDIPGVCEGDSGGPALLPAGVPEAQQTIVATTSYGNSATCVDATMAVGSRVSSEIGPGAFITSYLAGTPVGLLAGSPAALCQTCAQGADTGACQTEATACSNDAACLTLSTCLQGCTTEACEQTCSTTAGSTAVAQLNALNACVCGTACTTQCSMECAIPDGGTSCGVSSSNMACESCFDTHCCSEAEACSNDVTCAACLAPSPAASCATNTLLLAFDTCVSSSCGSACGSADAGVSGDAGTVKKDGGVDAGEEVIDASSHDGAIAKADGSMIPPGDDASVKPIDAGSADATEPHHEDSGLERATEGGVGHGSPGESSGCNLGGRGEGEPSAMGLVALAMFVAGRRRRTQRP